MAEIIHLGQDPDIDPEDQTDTEMDLDEVVELLLDDNPVMARAYYSTYTSLCEAGFEGHQALQIIIAHGWQLSLKEL